MTLKLYRRHRKEYPSISVALDRKLTPSCEPRMPELAMLRLLFVGANVVTLGVGQLRID